MKTWRNKILALVLIIAGLIPLILYKEGTPLVFTALIGVPLFFAKEEWVY